MKKLQIFVFLLFSFQVLSAQYLDIGLNPLRIVKAEISVEKGINKHFSFEAGFAYGQGNGIPLPETIRDSIFANPGSIRRYPIPSREIELFGGVRYYFFPEKGNDGLFIGSSLMYQKLVSIQDETYIEKPDHEAFWLRVPIGYKWVFDNRLVIELGLASVATKNATLDNSDTNEIKTTFQLLGKVAYRFSKNTNQ